MTFFKSVRFGIGSEACTTLVVAYGSVCDLMLLFWSLLTFIAQSDTEETTSQAPPPAETEVETVREAPPPEKNAEPEKAPEDEKKPEPAAEAIEAPAPSEPKPERETPKVIRSKVDPEKIIREMDKLRKLPPEQAAEEAERLQKRLSKTAEEMKATGTEAPRPPNLDEFKNQSETDQVRSVARDFFGRLLAGDARAVTGYCMTPFQLEDRRLATSDDVFQEWLRSLRSKRTDLLMLNGVEILSSTEMEKKYGKPPARLQNLPWRGSRTYIAVANISGHAAVAIFQSGARGWMASGYAD